MYTDKAKGSASGIQHLLLDFSLQKDLIYII